MRNCSSMVAGNPSARDTAAARSTTRSDHARGSSGCCALGGDDHRTQNRSSHRMAIKASRTVKEQSLLAETPHYYVQEGQIRKVSVSIMWKLLVPRDWRSHFGRRHLPRNPPA